MITEVDTCRKYVIPKLYAAGWTDDQITGEYCFVIQLIKHPDGENRVRFGYYKRKDGAENFRWGSQTTYDTTVDFTKELIKMAEKEGIL